MSDSREIGFVGEYQTMKVFLVRHGKAEEQGAVRDEDRSLTPKGLQQAHHLGRLAAAWDSPPSLILTSGLTRAIETARIIHAALRCRIEVARALEPGPDAHEVVHLIGAHAARDGSVMLVGHNPQLGEAAAILTCGFAGCETMLKTGECLVIEVDPSDLIGSGRVITRLRLEDRVARV